MLMRAPLRANRNRQRVVGQATVPAPVGGWAAESPLSDMPRAEFPVRSDVWGIDRNDMHGRHWEEYFSRFGSTRRRTDGMIVSH